MKNLKADFKRYQKEYGFLRVLFSPGFQATLVYRLGHYASQKCYLLYLFYYPAYYLIQILWGIGISHHAKIGPGLFISHFSDIFVHRNVTMGSNCNIAQDVTIGVKHNTNEGGPVIGDQVRVATGAKIIGDIKIGSWVIIGANAVVNKDVPDNVVVAGVPAKIITKITAQNKAKYYNEKS